MSRFRRGWALTKKSWGLLREHPELIRFPLYGAVATTLLAIVTIGPLSTERRRARAGSTCSRKTCWPGRSRSS